MRLRELTRKKEECEYFMQELFKCFTEEVHRTKRKKDVLMARMAMLSLVDLHEKCNFWSLAKIRQIIDDCKCKKYIITEQIRERAKPHSLWIGILKMPEQEDLKNR